MQYIIRKTLNKKFDTKVLASLIIVNAPKGFGKRTFISHYLHGHNMTYVWFRTSPNYDEEWQWINFQEKMKTTLQGYQKIETFPIPETEEELMNILYLYSQRMQEDVYIIIDSIMNMYPKLQKVIALFSRINTYRFHLILLCDMLHSEVLDLLGENVKFLKIDDFRLTYHEVMELFAKENIVISNEKVQSILTYTDGWIAAIELTALTLKRDNYIHETKNIHEMIQEAFYKYLSVDVKTDMMYLGILNQFTLEQMYALCKSNDTIKKILEMESNQLFIHGSPSEGYLISGLLKDFFKTQLYKSSLDIQAMYRNLAQWFLEKNDPIQAIMMYLECNDFEGIVQILTLHYEQSYMDIAPSLMIEVFKRMPMSYKYKNPYVYLSHILDTMTNIDTQHGCRLLDEFKDDVEHGKYDGNQQQLLGEYFFIHAFTYYNNASLMMDDFDQASEFFQDHKSKFAYPFMVASFGSYHLLYLYHHEKGQLKKLVDEIDQRLSTLVYLTNGVNGGGEYQVKAEQAYEIGDYTHVLELSQCAYQETLRYQQVSLQICNIFLRARYALLHRDTLLFQEMLSMLDDLYKKDNAPVLQSEIECAKAYLSLLEGNTREVVDWVKNERILYPQLLYEAGMISFIILCFYQLCEKNYEKALYYCGVLEQAYGEQMHIFGLLYTMLFKAIASYKLDNKTEGIQSLHDACDLAKGDHLITIFKELGVHIEELLEDFDEQNDFEIEVVSLLREHKAHSQERSIFHHLTRKEKEVMLKYASNMTTKQISEELVLSVNTIQTHLKNIFTKLKINSKVELVQIVNKEKMK